MNYTQLLSGVEMFEGLSDEQLSRIQAVCRERNYDANTTIFEESSPSKEMYIIAKGRVAIQLDPDLILKDEDAHQPQTITELTPGQSFGEIALVDQGVRSASAKAGDTPVVALELERETFMALMQDDLDMGFKVMRNLAADLCLKIRTTNLQVRENMLHV